MPRIRVLVMSVIAAGALALGLGATSASAAQTNLKLPPGLQIDLGPAVCSPGELIATVKSGHDNVVVNGNQYHENATAVVDVATVDANGNVLLTGKGEIWFTTNARNGFTTGVDEDAVNVKLSDGTGIHLHGSFNMAADGTIRVNRQQAVCS